MSVEKLPEPKDMSDPYDMISEAWKDSGGIKDAYARLTIRLNLISLAMGNLYGEVPDLDEEESDEGD